MWLTDAKVVDVVPGTIRDGVSVEISGGRIGAIQSGPGAGEQLSLDGRYLLPGLISVLRSYQRGSQPSGASMK